MHLHASFQTLNTLKYKRNKITATIERLTNYKNDGTLPTGLNHVTSCNITLYEDLHQRWVQTINASQTQLNLLLEQHQQTLNRTETKTQQSIKRIETNANTNEQARNIIKTTDHVRNKYSTRHLVRNTKSNFNQNKNSAKRLGKRTKTNTNVNNTTIARTLFTTPVQEQQPNQEQSLTPLIQQQRQPIRTLTKTPRPNAGHPLTTNANQPRNQNPTLHQLLTNDIQQQIQNFLTPTHLQNYLEQTQKWLNKPK